MQFPDATRPRYDSRRRGPLFAMLMCASMVSACTQPDSHLSISDTERDLGIVTPNDERGANATLRITNTGDAPNDITRFLTSCNCAKIQPLALSIPAHDSREIAISLELSNSMRAPGRDRLVPFDVLITAMATDVQLSAFQVHGKVLRAIKCDPPSLHFGECVGGVLSASLDVAVDVLGPGEHLELTTSDGVVASLDEASSLKGGARRLSIQINPPRVEHSAEFAGYVLVRSVANNEGKETITRIPIRGRVIPDIELVPSTLVLNSREDLSGIQLNAFSRTGRDWRLVGVQDALKSHIETQYSTIWSSEFEIHCSIADVKPRTGFVQSHLKLSFEDREGNIAEIQVPWTMLICDAIRQDN